jgi:hypothetical protein
MQTASKRVDLATGIHKTSNLCFDNGWQLAARHTFLVAAVLKHASGQRTKFQLIAAYSVALFD